MSYYRRGYNWEQVEYLPAPVGGWNPDTNPWEMPANQAPVLDNALIRPGQVNVRGAFVNWADLSADAPLALTGSQPVPGAPALLLGRKALSATAFVDPVFAPISRPALAASLAQAATPALIASGGTSTTSPAVTNTTSPGASGCMYEGNRYYLSYSGAAVQDMGTSYWAAKTHLCTINSTQTITEFTNAPEGGLAIDSYQERIWMLGGVDTPGSGTSFSPLRLMFTNAPLGVGGGNAAAFADWKDPVAGTTNQILMDGDWYDPGIGLATYRNALLIFRYQSIYRLSGSTTANYQLLPVTKDIGCIDARSIVETSNGVFFISKQGLMVTDGVTVKNVSGNARHTLENAISVVLTSIKSGYGGYITGTVTDDGQIVLSMGIPSITSGNIDGHLQPVWCAMFDPALNAWTRLTSALWLDDGVQTVPGNTYPGLLINTPDQRLLALGDKRITLLESEAGAGATTFSHLQNTGSSAANVAGTGTLAWQNPTHIENLGPSNPGTPGANYADLNASTNTVSYFPAGAGSNDPTTHFGTPDATWTNPGFLNEYIDGNNAELSSGGGTFTGEGLRAGTFGFSIPSDAYVVEGLVQNVSWHSYSDGTGSYTQGQMALCWGTPGTNYSPAYSYTSGNTPFQGGAFTPSTTYWTIPGVAIPAASVNSTNFGAIWVNVTVTGTAQSVATLGVGGFQLSIVYVQSSEYLQATNYGFAIPTNATIVGILVEVLKIDGTKLAVDSHVQLLKAGVLTGADKASAVVWSNHWATKGYGGSSSLWSTTWTPADINNPGFGVALAVQPAATGSSIGTVWDPGVSYMTITVYYTVGFSTTAQTFLQQSALYDIDASGNFQPIPFNWTTRFVPIVGTTTLARKFGQIKRWFLDYVFAGSSLPSANGFTVTPITTTIPSDVVPGTMDTVIVPVSATDMQPTSVSGGQLTAAQDIMRVNQDAQTELADLQFQITWSDATQSSAPTAVAAQCLGIGIEFQPTRDLR